MSSANRNVRTDEFRKLFERLPSRIQNLARLAYQRFLQDPGHNSLRRHELEDSDKGRHRKGSISFSITLQYRAICVIDEGVNVWYWIGNHNDYENFIGKK
jgi:hypothetical protein